jgi:hypothetical protein
MHNNLQLQFCFFQADVQQNLLLATIQLRSICLPRYVAAMLRVYILQYSARD